MAEPAIQLPIELELIRDDLGKLRSSIDQFTGRANRGFSRAGRGVSTLNKGLATLAAFAGPLLGVAVGVGAVGVALGRAGRAGQGFERELSDISTLIDISDQRLESLGDQILDVAANFRLNSIDAVLGQYQALSAGIDDVDDNLGFLNVAAQAARAGSASLADSVKVTSAILNAYGKDVSEAEDVTDALFVTVREGVTTFGELSGAIGPVLPLAAELDVSIGELNAAVGALTRGGFSTDKAITGLSGTLQKVLKPSEQAKQIAAELGVEFNRDALAAQGLLPFLEGLREATGDNAEAFARLLEEESAIRTGFALTGSAAEEFARQLDLQSERAGAAGRALEQQLRNPVLALDEAYAQLGVGVENFGRRLQRTLGRVLIYARENENIQRLTERLGLSIDLLTEGGFAALEESLKGTVDRLANASDLFEQLTVSVTDAGIKTSLFLADLAGFDISRATRSLDQFNRGILSSSQAAQAIISDLSGETANLRFSEVVDEEAQATREAFLEIEGVVRDAIEEIAGEAQAAAFEFDFADEMAEAFEAEVRRGLERTRVQTDSQTKVAVENAGLSTGADFINAIRAGLRLGAGGTSAVSEHVNEAIKAGFEGGVERARASGDLSGGDLVLLQEFADGIRENAPILERAFSQALKAASDGAADELERSIEDISSVLSSIGDVEGGVSVDLDLFDSAALSSLNQILTETGGLLVETSRGFELLVGITRDVTGSVRADFEAVNDSLALTAQQLEDFRRGTGGFSIGVTFREAEVRQTLDVLLSELERSRTLSLDVDIDDNISAAIGALGDRAEGLLFRTSVEVDEAPAIEALDRLKVALAGAGSDLREVSSDVREFLSVANSSAVFSVNVSGGEEARDLFTEIANRLEQAGSIGIEDDIEAALRAADRAVAGAVDASPVVALREELSLLAQESRDLAESGLPLQVRAVGIERFQERLFDLQGQTVEIAASVQAEVPRQVLEQLGRDIEATRAGLQAQLDADPLAAPVQILPPNVQEARRLVQSAVEGGLRLGGELSPQLQDAVDTIGEFVQAQVRAREIAAELRLEQSQGAEAVAEAAIAARDASLQELDALERQGVAVAGLRSQINELTEARIREARAAENREESEASIERERERAELAAELVRLSGQLKGGVAEEVAEIRAAAQARTAQISADIQLRELRGENADALREELNLVLQIASQDEARASSGDRSGEVDELSRSLEVLLSNLQRELIQIERNEAAALDALRSRVDLTDEVARATEGLIRRSADLQRADTFRGVFESSSAARGRIDLLNAAFLESADALTELELRGIDTSAMIDEIGRRAQSSGEAIRRGLADGARDAVNQITNLNALSANLSFDAITGSADALARTIASIGDESQKTSEVAKEAFRGVLEEVRLNLARQAVGGLFEATGLSGLLGGAAQSPEERTASELQSAAQSQREAALELLAAARSLQGVAAPTGSPTAPRGPAPLQAPGGVAGSVASFLGSLGPSPQAEEADAGLSEAASDLEAAASSLDEGGRQLPIQAQTFLGSLNVGLQSLFQGIFTQIAGSLFGSGAGGLASFFANGGRIPGGLSRSVPVRGYASGGRVFREPHIGVIGEGNFDEAAVPLPDGNSIPVTLRVRGGGQGQGAAASITNNFTIQAIDAATGFDFIESRAAQITSLMVRGLEGESDPLRTAVADVAR